MGTKRYLTLLLFMVFANHVKAQLRSENYIGRYGTLSHFFEAVKHEKKATVAFLGGSITNMDGWRNLVCDDLQKKYPEVKFTFINAGIPSLGSLPHAFRLQHDVLDKGNIDLLFIESAVNDKVNGTPAKVQQRALEGIIRHVHQANAHTDMVMMAFVDPDKMADYKAGKIPAEVQLHQNLAKYYHLDFINLAKEVTDRIAAGEFTWDKDFVSLHPSPFGMNVYFKTISTLLDASKSKRGAASVKFPLPMDKGNYSNGHYLDIHKAYFNVITGSVSAEANTSLFKFKITEDWFPADKASTREGFVHVPVLETTEAGSVVTIDFSGKMIGIGVLSGPDAGIIDYTVDDKPYGPINLYTAWSDGLHLPFYFVLADDLKPGHHTLQIKVNSRSSNKLNGTAVRIINFLEN
jgi:lysophospholipase L1-like esterase